MNGLNSSADKYSVLFVCLGNICRSPTAEGVFRRKAELAGIADRLFIDSAGNSAHHVGEPSDPRSQLEAKRYGYDLSSIRSRQVTTRDFEQFDLIIAMDKVNLYELNHLKTNACDAKLKLFLEEYSPNSSVSEVPDPYYGGDKGFSRVVELIEEASDGLIEQIKLEQGCGE